MHPGTPTIDEVQAAVLVGTDVVGLDRFLRGRGCRHIAADFLRLERIAHVDGTQAGVEIGQEHQIGPRPFRCDVLKNVVSAEAARTIEVFLAVGNEVGDWHRIRLVADIDHPHELAVPVFLSRAPRP